MMATGGSGFPVKGSIVSSITEVVASIRTIISDVLNGYKCVNHALDEIEKEVSFQAHEDPRVAMQIEEFKQALKEINVYCGRYVVACKTLARYCSNQRHIQRIKDDLETGSVMKLKQFILDIGSRLHRCHQRLNEYNHMFEDLQKKTKDFTNGNAAAMEIKEKSVKNKHKVSRRTGVAAAATGTLALASSGATAAAFITPFVFPPAAIVAVPLGIIGLVASGVLATGTVATAGTSVGFALAKVFSAQELELLKKAALSVSKLQENMNESKIKICKLEVCVKNAADCVEGSTIDSNDGLVHIVADPKYDDDGELESLWDIEDKLDEIQSEMEKVLRMVDDESQG